MCALRPAQIHCQVTWVTGLCDQVSSKVPSLGETMVRNSLFASTLAALLSIAGCAADGGTKSSGPGGPGGTAGTAAGASGDGAAGFGNVGSSGTGVVGGSGGGADASVLDNTGGGCVNIEDESPVARGAVDIIWIIDNSGSMFDEYTRVKENLNAFANDIQNAGIDHHVITITGAAVAVVFPTGDPAVGTALGMDPAHYLYVPHEVTSWDAMDVLVSSFPQWSSFLRPDAPTHFVVVTDDDQRPPVNLDAATFKTQMEGLLGHPFIYHSIASETPTCPGASAPGVQHYAASDATGGLKVSVCIADWSGVFGPLKEAVVKSAPLPCSFDIPEPPPGKTFEKERVNFEYTADMGTAMPWPRANQAADCGTQIGWHYDDFDAPTRIELCPAGCDAVSGGGKISIVFGCAEPPLIVPE